MYTNKIEDVITHPLKYFHKFQIDNYYQNKYTITILI